MIEATRRTFVGSLALAALVGPARASSRGTLRFGVTVADNVVYAPAFAAQELGYFDAAGLKVTIVPLRGKATCSRSPSRSPSTRRS